MGKYKTYDGHHESLLRYMKITISAIVNNNNYSALYVGATGNIPERFKNYENWQIKHPLYVTTDIEVAKFVEEHLIEYIKKFGDRCNKHEDSKGLVKGSEKYHIYVLADEKCETRD